eukprot:1184805-Prorocentrum_minimum.AAC.1
MSYLVGAVVLVDHVEHVQRGAGGVEAGTADGERVAKLVVRVEEEARRHAHQRGRDAPRPRARLPGVRRTRRHRHAPCERLQARVHISIAKDRNRGN